MGSYQVDLNILDIFINVLLIFQFDCLIMVVLLINYFIKLLHSNLVFKF